MPGCPIHGENESAGCRPCWLWRNDPRYQALWAEGAAPPAIQSRQQWQPAPGRVVSGPAPAQPAPCRHRGDELTGYERQARGLLAVRTFYHCGHPERPLGDVVTHCRCGPGCPKYAAGD